MNNKERTLGSRLAQIFVSVLVGCVTSIVVAFTIKLILMMF